MAEIHSHHSYYYKDADEEPTQAEINIFRLYKCSECGNWISLVGVEKGDVSYKQIEAIGFEQATGHIVWR